MIKIRNAIQSDLAQLVNIEVICFAVDRLSARSFRHFIKPGSHDLLVLTENHQVKAYALVLYRTGTNLARLYSIAVLPDNQGKGFAKKLLTAIEREVLKRYCIFIRLEVNVSNYRAIELYSKLGYMTIGQIPEYYEDGSDAMRMEKRLQKMPGKKIQARPYYEQTTDFTSFVNDGH